MPAMSETSGPRLRVTVMPAPKRGSGLGAGAPDHHRQHRMLGTRLGRRLAARGGALLAHDLGKFLLQVGIERRGIAERLVGESDHVSSPSMCGTRYQL